MDDLIFFILLNRTSTIATYASAAFAFLLLAKSLAHYSQTGPQLNRKLPSNYRLYLAFSLARLTLAAFLLSLLLMVPGVMAYILGLALFDLPYSPPHAFLACIASLVVLTLFQMCRILLASPGIIVASSQYSIHRVFTLWGMLTPRRLKIATGLLLGGWTVWAIAGCLALADAGATRAVATLLVLHGIVLGIAVWIREREPPLHAHTDADSPPNLLMIGSDTLRWDRLGARRNGQSLTPNLDRLAAGGAVLEQCYVPCARTAPSLLSLFNGTWPHTHGVRDNFVADDHTWITYPALPRLLRQAGYRTMALGDWAGADLGKFNLGFEELDVPEDQWNLKFFLRQGPKDIRLFLSMFVHNRIGKLLLEEIYYLAGIPLTRQLGLRTRRALAQLGQDRQPFFLNVFMASTHPPFASEYPYYTTFAGRDYRGPSKFAMARLTDPFEIIRRQAEPREEFDLDQILNLYDGCVRSFDDEVGRILDYLDISGLRRNTLVVVYSDHGMEFFEHGTWGQGNSAIGDFSARIPVILAGPPIPEAVRLVSVTRSVDLAPTLLELFGLSPSPGMEGVSLAPALRGAPLPELPAFYETGVWLTQMPGMPKQHLRYPGLLDLLEVPVSKSGTLAIKPEFAHRIIRAKDRMVRLGDWKLVYQPLEDGQALSLFDLNRDPHCRTDVLAEHPRMAQQLSDMLKTWIAQDRTLHCPDGDWPRDLPDNNPGKRDDRRNREMPPTKSLRAHMLHLSRTLDNWTWERTSRRTRVLFVHSDAYGFTCQAPVIRALQRYHGVLIRTTSDRNQPHSELEFSDPLERDLFLSMALPTQRARFHKWHMVVDTHINAFYPARSALRLYMHHGPGFGILGNKVGVIKQCDIFCGLSQTERDWFERLDPTLFGRHRTFFAIGFPKNDALHRGEYDRDAILRRLGLPSRKTLLITSHWQTSSTLRRLNGGPFNALATAFADCNVIQTGHPWLWRTSHNIPAEWQQSLMDDLRKTEATCPNARFLQTSDVESLLAVTDLLVGDYSSVMTTYSLLDRPIVYFDDPEFEFTIPALKQVFVDAAHTFTRMEDLVDRCREALANPSAKMAGRSRMRKTFYSNEGRSGEYMAEIIFQIGRTCSVQSRRWSQVLDLAEQERFSSIERMNR